MFKITLRALFAWRGSSNKFAYSRHDVNSEETECVFAEIHLPKTKPFIIGTLYRPPQDQNFLTRFEDIITELRSDLDTVILSDFNICLQNTKHALYENYKNVLHLFDFTQLIGNPSRISDKGSSLIDHILVNNREKFVQFGTV